MSRWKNTTTIIGGLLAWLGCNAMLGIDESTCVGPCDESSAAEGSSDGSRPGGGDTPTGDPAPATAAGSERPRTGTAASSAAEGASSEELGLDEIIAAQCPDDGSEDDSAQEGSAEPFCVGNRRVSCGVGGAAASVTVCASADHCGRGTGAECAACSSQSVCQGAELWRCDTRRSEMVLAETCASAALCDAALGACVAATCLPDQTRCQGASFESCNASGTEFVRVEQCQNAIACDPEAGCQAPECSAGQRRCAGGALQECNENSTGFDNVQNCGVPALCNATEGRCNECVPGVRRCESASTVAVCDGAGLTETTIACRPLLEACEDGECVLLGLPL